MSLGPSSDRPTISLLTTTTTAAACSVLLVALFVPGWVNSAASSTSTIDQQPLAEPQPWPCTIPRVSLTSLSSSSSLPLGRSRTPFIMVMDDDRHNENNDESTSCKVHNAHFASLVAKDALVASYGHLEARLLPYTNTNNATGPDGVVSLQTYLTKLLQADHWDGTRVKETRYLFGNSRGEGWKDLFQHYVRPPCATCGEEKGVLNFGAGGLHSGVGWHTHGPAYSETLWGRKRWFLYPASVSNPPGFDPDKTTLAWTQDTWPSVKDAHPPLQEGEKEESEEEEKLLKNTTTGKKKITAEAFAKPPLTCDLVPGEILYVPSRWWHAVMNVGEYNAFMTTFSHE